MLTKAKCPACGGALELNPGLERGICVYCGGEFLVQEAIQKFKAEVDGLPTLQNMLIRAEQKLADGDLKGAEALYEEILKGAPTCHEAWWGMFRSYEEPHKVEEGLPYFFSRFKYGWLGGIPTRMEVTITRRDILREEKNVEDAVAALDRVDLQYLFGKNATNALRAIEYAPEELKGVYHQKLDQILKDCKKISEDMKEKLAELEGNRQSGKKIKIRLFLVYIVFCAFIGGLNASEPWEGVFGGVIAGVILLAFGMFLSFIGY